MRDGYKNRLSRFSLAVLFMAVSLAAPVSADVQTKPYFKTYGADVMSGGWFYGASGCDTSDSSNYQDPGFSNATYPRDDKHGGILTYANQNPANPANATGGSSSQYGAFALGQVDGNASGNGFYSGGSSSTSGYAKTLLTFANSTANWGGVFELGPGNAGIRMSTCIPDYYSKRPSTGPNLGSPLNGAISQVQGGTYRGLSYGACSPGVYCLTQTNVQINAGTRMVIFVNGNVYIDKNITYQAHDANSIPKFTLVVKGSIYISGSVTRLDGFYIAQPSSSSVSADDGMIWTCHDNTTNALYYRIPANQCNNTLVVNGALVAKQVNFLRLKGNVSTANTSEDNFSTVNTCMTSGCNVAEVINYTPEMAIGGSMFDTTGSGGGGGTPAGPPPTDSLISLPPAF